MLLIQRRPRQSAALQTDGHLQLYAEETFVSRLSLGRLYLDALLLSAQVQAPNLKLRWA